MASTATYLGMGVEELIRAIIAGIQANMSATDKVMYGGKLLGKTELVAVLTKLLEPYDEVEAARKELSAKVAARDEAAPDAISALKAIDGGLTAKYSADPHVKAKLGIPPPPNRRQLTAAEKAVRAQKAADTRELRGTKGSRQKAKIKATGDYSLSISSGSTGTDSSSPTATVPIAAAPQPVSTPTDSASPPAPVASAPVATALPVVTTAQPAPAVPGSATASNGVSSNGSVAPMLMNGAGH